MSRVYIGKLSKRCTEGDVKRFFRNYGRLREVVIKDGYGFAEFDSEKDADDAVYDLHGRELCGSRIIVEHARLPPGSRGGSRRYGNGRDSRRYGPPTRTEYRVVVENLSSRVSWQDLKDMMRKAGEVTYADAHKSARNDGIVEFAAYADMKEAIKKFDGYELYGRRLRVYEDRNDRGSRSGSRRSRSGSRERRSNRSRSRDSFRRQPSPSPRRRLKRSASSDRRRSNSRVDSHKRSRDMSADARSRSGSHRSESHHSRERSASHHSDKRSEGVQSRSASRNGREGSVKEGSERRSRSRSASGSHSRSRSRSGGSNTPVRSRSSRSRSQSGSHQSRSPDNRRSDDDLDNSGRRSDYEHEAVEQD